MYGQTARPVTAFTTGDHEKRSFLHGRTRMKRASIVKRLVFVFAIAAVCAGSALAAA
jgi:hypothetical protein